MAKVSKTELRRKAQDMVMDGIAVKLGYWQESVDRLDLPEGVTSEMMHEELQKQADRVAKMFGFDKAWGA